VRIIEKISFDSGRIQLRVDGSTKTGMISVRPGDLVVSGINAAKGAIAIYDANETAPVAATIHYAAYEANPQRADVRFLWWMLRSHFFKELLFEYVPGGIKTELKAKRLLPVPVPLPPLAAQRRVVARIEELAAQIHEARTLRHQAAEEAEAIVESASRSKFGLPEFEVGDIADVTKLAGFEHTKFLAGAPPGDVILLRAGNVRNHGLDLSNAATIPSVISDQLPRSQLAQNDVVMTFIGAKIGDVSFVSPEHPRMHCGPNVAKLTPKETIDHRYLVAALQAPVVQDQIREITKLTAQPNLSMKTIRKLRLPVPPFTEQRRIVAELDALQAEVDALKRLQAETASELDALLPSILDKAFKGEL
jgi:type I restriction enzyme S subunit